MRSRLEVKKIRLAILSPLKKSPTYEDRELSFFDLTQKNDDSVVSVMSRQPTTKPTFTSELVTAKSDAL